MKDALRLSWAALMVMGLLIAPAPALSATVAVEPGGPALTAQPGEVNSVVVVRVAGAYTFTDAGPLTPGLGCVSLDANRVRCQASSGRVTLRLGDRDDRGTATGAECVCRGGFGNDRLEGGANRDQLLGEEGDDRLLGGRGADLFDGGGGIDTVDYSDHGSGVNVTLDDLSNDGDVSDGPPGQRDRARNGIENVDGSPGADHLGGSAGPNLLRGEGGSDVVQGEGGHDAAEGGEGDDQLNGGAGGDALRGGPGSDMVGYLGHSAGVTATLDGAPGDGNGEDGPAGDHIAADVESLGGSGGADGLTGNGAANTLIGQGGADVIQGGGGPDAVGGGDGADDLAGGAGVDSTTYSQRTADVDVTLDGAANDGGAQDGRADNVRVDVEGITGGAGADRLSAVGRTTPTTLRGGRGNDVLLGGSARDLLEGDEGEDRIEDGLGADLSFGGPGADVIRSGGGEDVLDGGEGDDDISAPVFDNQHRTLRGGAGNDRLQGSPEHPNTIEGGPGDDLLVGGQRPDALDGGDGADLLRGGFYHDALRGGPGDDELDGGQGADLMTGGEGFDTVRYDTGRPPGGVVVDTAPGNRDGNDWDCGAENAECLLDPDNPQARGDRSDGVDDAERVLGTGQPDILTGDDGPNALVAGGGEDAVDGRGGDDLIDTRDGARDTVRCGAGNDTVLADRLDQIDNVRCETIQRA